jgi:hypothetical protein
VSVLFLYQRDTVCSEVLRSGDHRDGIIPSMGGIYVKIQHASADDVWCRQCIGSDKELSIVSLDGRGAAHDVAAFVPHNVSLWQIRRVAAGKDNHCNLAQDAIARQSWLWRDLWQAIVNR